MEVSWRAACLLCNRGSFGVLREALNLTSDAPVPICYNSTIIWVQAGLAWVHYKDKEEERCEHEED